MAQSSSSMDEVMKFIAENAIKIEEVRYSGKEEGTRAVWYNDDIMTEQLLEDSTLKEGDEVHTTDNDDFAAAYYVKDRNGLSHVYIYGVGRDSDKGAYKK